MTKRKVVPHRIARILMAMNEAYGVIVQVPFFWEIRDERVQVELEGHGLNLPRIKRIGRIKIRLIR